MTEFYTEMQQIRKAQNKQHRGGLKEKISIFILVVLLFSILYPLSARAEGTITIDTNKRYKGMDASFARGYEPSIRKDMMTLVIPFVAGTEIEKNRMIVGVSFEREENSPFYYKNYQKQVKRLEDGIYLYRCQIRLKEERINGQYPLYLSVQARTPEGVIQQNFTIYVEITDGKTKAYAPEGLEEEEEPEIPVEENIPTESVVSEPISEPSGQEEEITHQPRVLLAQNSLQGTGLWAGSSTLWKLCAKNYSSSQTVENMKVTLLCENKDISFEKNVWYFERTKAGETIDLSQNITVGKKAAAEPAAVQLQFEYEDTKGNSYTSAETVHIPISQPQQAELVNLSFPDSIYESDTDSLTFQIHNTGLAIIYNAKVRLEGKGLFPVQELYLGNIESGASVDGEMQVFAGTLNMNEQGEIVEEDGEKYGDTSGTVIFSYEDEQGEITEQKLKLHTTIKEPQTVELKVEKEQPQTNQWWITIAVGIFLVLILIMLWLYIRMNYYRKRMEAHEKPQQQ